MAKKRKEAKIKNRKNKKRPPPSAALRNVASAECCLIHGWGGPREGRGGRVAAGEKAKTISSLQQSGRGGADAAGETKKREENER
jgi:hypothetical protein